jgi:hypothetical protein
MANSITRDTKTEIVLGMPIWFRVIGWLFLLVFSTLFISGLVMILADNSSAGYWISVISFTLVLASIWIVGMTTKLTFNKPNGFITVTSGHVPLFPWFKRTRVISKEEAKNAFVAFHDTQTLIGQIGVLLLSLMALVPIDRHKRTSYGVKIEMASGKEVQLVRSRNADLADYLVKRIVSFGEGISSDKIFLEGQAAKVQKAQMARASTLKTAGILEIICSPLVFFTFLYTYYGLSYEGWYELADGSGLVIVISIMAIIAVLPIIGGIYALKLRKWWLALAGSIVSLVFLLFGIIAFILILDSKDEFE